MTPLESDPFAGRRKFAEDTRAYVADFLKFGDAKAGALLGFGVTVAASMGALLERSADAVFAAPVGYRWALAPVAMAVVYATVMLTVHTIHALAPNTPDADESLASFPDISKLSTPEYSKRCGGLSDDGWALQYERHSVALAKIAQLKFSHIRSGVWWLKVLVFTSYVLVLLLAVLKVNTHK